VYNLLIGFRENTAMGGRVFEYTDQALLDYVQPAGVLDVTRLLNLPALVMPEVGDSYSAPVARVGRITSLQRNGSDYRFTFRHNPALSPLSTDRIAALAPDLAIGEWELRRTHWAVKDADLYGVLLDSDGAQRLEPRVFRFPVETPEEPDLVAVMMPFSADNDPVYAAIKGTVEGMGLRCHRADDIWESHNVMDDVIGLIWRSRVVIADLTSKNPNVFYETGITHALGRDVVPIAQSIEDVPFDLRGIRTLTYVRSSEGLEILKQGLRSRIETLTKAVSGPS
jgi:hypothetical protein